MIESDKPTTWSRKPLGLETVEVDGLPFVATTMTELVKRITDSAGRGGGGWVVTPNIDILRRWRNDLAFRELVTGASLFTPDGAPIVWASRLQRTPLPCRLTGADLFVQLYVNAARAGLRIALIGGNPGAAEEAVRILAEQHDVPKDCVRTHCPPFGFEKNPTEMASMKSLLQSWKPQLVFVGLGSPKQEVLIHDLMPSLPNAWYFGVGVSFSFVAGDVQRAPDWVQHVGLEWLYRVLQEPKRLAKRYLVDGVPFALSLMVRSIVRSGK
tara:strand:+ start:38886 stop:39692 length:807 start_codon:yes stop_codon:yes gene_type:complete